MQLGGGEQEIHDRGRSRLRAARSQGRPGIGQAAQLPEQVHTLAPESTWRSASSSPICAAPMTLRKKSSR